MKMRMANGFGSVDKLPGKRRNPFRARKTKCFTDEGKQIFITLGYFENLLSAVAALKEYNDNPYDIQANSITFSEVYEKWSGQHYEKVSESAIVNYSNAYNKYCASLYKMRMRDIRLAHLQAVIDDSGMGHPTRAVIKTLLRVLYKFSMKNDIVEKDYSVFVDVGKREGKINRTPFTNEEIQKLWDNVDKLDFIDTVLIMIYTGMRVRRIIKYIYRKCTPR